MYRLMIVFYKIRMLLNIVRALLACKSKDYNKELDGTVIFERLDGGWFFLLCDYVISSVYAEHGCKSIVITDEHGLISHYDNNAKIRNGKVGLIYRLITIYIKRYSLNVEFLDISNLTKGGGFSAKVDEDSYQDISGLVLDSHRRKFHGRDYDSENVNHVEYAKENIINYNVLKFVAETLISKYQPKLLVALDGTYVARGTLPKYMKERGVNVMLYRPDNFSDRGMYIGSSPYTVNNNDLPWVKYSEKHQGTEEGKAILKARVTPALDDTENEIIQSLMEKKNHYDGVIGLFPNLTWDGAINERDEIFLSLSDWIIKTISWAEKNNYLVVLREHPQPKGVYGFRDSVTSLLKETRPDLINSNNLFVITGLQQCSSYHLARELLDISITYGGTLTVELAALKLPVIQAAKSLYTGNGIVLHLQNQDEYFDIIKHPNRAVVDGAELRAMSFLNYIFNVNSNYFPLFPRLDVIKKFKRSSVKYIVDWDIRSLDSARSESWEDTKIKLLDFLKG